MLIAYGASCTILLRWGRKIFPDNLFRHKMFGENVNGVRNFWTKLLVSFHPLPGIINNHSLIQFRVGTFLVIFRSRIHLATYRSIQKSCSTQHTLLGTFLLLARRAKTDWHSNIVIRCWRNLFSLSFVMDICNFVRLDMGILVSFDHFRRS